MKRQMLYAFAAVQLLLAPTALALDDAPLPDIERGPRVILNPHPLNMKTFAATGFVSTDRTTSAIKGVGGCIGPTFISIPGNGKRPTVRQTEGRKTMALALGGGGARGAAHIGVLRVLQQENIPIDYIVGNSMGAIIGGSYAAGVSLEKMEMAGLSGELRRYYMQGIVPRVLLMPLSQIANMLNLEKRYAGLWTGRTFEKYLDRMLPANVPPIECLKIPFSAVATNLKDGNAYRLSEGKLSRAIRASATMSPLLKPVKIGDDLYVDGGMRANLPASAAQDTEADIVVGVLVDDRMETLPDKAFYKYKTIATRLADIILAATDEHQLKYADITIFPDVSGIPILSAEPTDVAKAIRAGEIAALKALPIIRQKMGLRQCSQMAGQVLPLE